MTPTGNGAARFRVSPVGFSLQSLRDCHREARAHGIVPAFLSALRVINHRLHNDPEIFGEPLYRLIHLQLLVRTGSVGPLSVRYAVDEQRRIVYFMGARLSPQQA